MYRCWLHYINQMVNKCPPLVTVFIQITYYSTSLRFILILSSLLSLGPGVFSSNFTIKPCRHLSSPSYVLHALPILILHDVITQIIFGEEYRSRSCQLCDRIQSPVTSSLLVPDIFLSTLFFNTLSLWHSSNARDQVSCQYTTAG